MVQCKNCSTQVDKQYCSNCGQSVSVGRFTIKSLLNEFIHGFYHVDHGILYTFKQLSLHPGKMLKEYLAGKRKNHINPFTYLLLLSGILTLVLPQLINRSIFEEFGIVGAQEADSHLLKSSFKHLSIRMILLLPVYASLSFIFFRKTNYNFAEHLIAQTYLRGQTELLAIVLTPFLFLLQHHEGMAAFIIVFYAAQMIYYTWAYIGLFRAKSQGHAYLQSIACSALSVFLEITLSNATLLSANTMMH